MIVRRPSRPLTMAAVLGFALAAAVLAAPTSASAQEKAEDVPLDSRIMRGILESLGLRKDGEAVINYQERAPLVIPPASATLPPPEQPDAMIANNPAWPKDPDVKRRRDEAKRVAAEAYVSADEKMRAEQRPLRPDELTPGGRGAASPPRSRDRTATTFIESGDKLSPTQLGYRGGLFGNMFGGKEDEVARFTGEPPRTALTEPPSGYQTPSPDQPYGLSGRTTAPKATNYSESRGVASPDR